MDPDHLTVSAGAGAIIENLFFCIADAGVCAAQLMWPGMGKPQSGKVSGWGMVTKSNRQSVGMGVGNKLKSAKWPTGGGRLEGRSPRVVTTTRCLARVADVVRRWLRARARRLSALWALSALSALSARRPPRLHFLGPAAHLAPAGTGAPFRT